jgi:hypothetical protein
MYRLVNDLRAYTLTHSKTLEPLPEGTNVREVEIWAPIAGYEDSHYVSSWGRVFRVKPLQRRSNPKTQNPFRKSPRTHFLKQCSTPKGYQIVNLYKYTKTVHSIVLETFIGARPHGLWARHHDGNKKNNRLDNLSWDTPRTNIHDKFKHGTICRGEKFWSAKLKEADIPRAYELFEAGHTHETIGKQLGVSGSTITRLLLGQSWKHVPRPI